MENFFPIPPMLPLYEGQGEVNQNEYRHMLDNSQTVGTGTSAHRPNHYQENPPPYNVTADLPSLPMQINAFDARSMQYVSSHFQNSSTPILIIPQQNTNQFVLTPSDEVCKKEDRDQNNSLAFQNHPTSNIQVEVPVSKTDDSNISSSDTVAMEKMEQNDQYCNKNSKLVENSKMIDSINVGDPDDEETDSMEDSGKKKADVNSSESLQEETSEEELENHTTNEKPSIKTCTHCKAMFTSLTDKGVLTSNDNNFICQSCKESSLNTQDFIINISFGGKNTNFNLGDTKDEHFNIRLKGLDKGNKGNIVLEVSCGTKVEKLDISEKDLTSGELSIECKREHVIVNSSLLPCVKTFTCSDCGESFLDTKSLADHKLSHPGHKPWVCLDCGKEFKYNNLLLRHQLSHTNIKDHECPECEKKFRTKANLKRHLSAFHKVVSPEKKSEREDRKDSPNPDELAPNDEEPLEEDELTDNLENHDELENPELFEEKYMESIPTRPKSTNVNKFVPKIIYHCKMCNKGFGNKGKWKRHELYHFQMRMPVCEQCGKSFVDKDYLMEHLRTHEEAYADHICKECGMEFPFKDELKHHILGHESPEDNFVPNADILNVPPNEDGQFPCTECDKVFRSNYILQRHLLTHNRANSQCPECGKFYSCRYNLVQHMAIHDTKNNYICDQCGESFKVKQYLSRHMIKHREQKTWQCNICDLKFYRQGNLRHHMKQHVENKPFQCQHCHKSFVRERTLDEHVLLAHTNERPYQCTICGRGFALQRMLKPHMKIHSGFKEHKCEECGKLFTYKSNLNQHMMIHSGEKPFICQFCGKGFARNKYLNDHMRTHNIVNNSF